MGLDYEDLAWLRKIYVAGTGIRTSRDKRIIAWLDEQCVRATGHPTAAASQTTAIAPGSPRAMRQS